MVAAFGNFQIRIVPRRELDAGLGHQVGEGVMRLGQRLMHMTHHLVGGMRPRHRKHPRMHLLNQR